MVYRRYNRRRFRRRRRRGGFFSSAGKAIAMAGSALALARGVKSLINVEHKYHDRAAGSATPFYTAPQVTCHSLIAQGDDDTNRNGRSVKATSFNLRATMKHNVSGDDVQFMRLICFMDKHGAGATPSASDIIEGNDMISFRVIENTDRFRFLMDKTFQLSNDSREAVVFKKSWKLNTHLEFIGTGSTVADAGANSIWCIAFSDKTADGPNIVLNSRLRYIDN